MTDIKMMTSGEETGFPEYKHQPLKSQQKSIIFPTIELPFSSMEIDFVLSAHEAIISKFKLNKRFIEKELSQLFQTAKKMKKTGKDQPDVTIKGIEELQEKLQITKKQYLDMIKVEDGLIHALEQRLKHLAHISKNLDEQKVVKEYFETKLTRVILDYFLQNSYFETARIFANESSIEVFSDIEMFIETQDIMSKLKIGHAESQKPVPNSKTLHECIDAALSWCSVYKTKLANSDS